MQNYSQFSERRKIYSQFYSQFFLKDTLEMKIKSYVDKRKPSKDGRMPVCISVNYSGERFFINTGMFTTEAFDGDAFPDSQSNAKKKTRLLCSMILETESYIMSHQQLLPSEMKEALKRDVLTDVVQKKKEKTLADMMMEYAGTLEKDGTKDIYARTVSRIEKYDSRITIDAVTPEWLSDFRNYLLKELKMNTVAIYLRNIKTTINWMRRKKMTTNDPFLEFRIVTEQTTPNNIPVERLRQFLSYPCETWQEPYRDFFKLSLLLAGINGVDLLTMKRSALKDGYISFVRQKTNKQNAQTIRTITIPVYKEAQEIIDKYKSNEDWLLSFMDCRNDYRSFIRECNDALKKIGPTRKVKDKVGKLRKVEYDAICPNITMYSARYSFGSIAVNDLDISEHAVGMCLGHSWAKTVTAHYISHDQGKIDRTIRKVIDYILYNKE